MVLPEFTEKEVDAVVNAFGITCDAERRAILKHPTSVDIRACAGSGKTTLLVAKLALLLSHWTDQFRGIAILSHTNVAHQEIRQRFSTMPRLRALEKYPHFLGTIQSFVNMTLGTPGAVERFGVHPAVIDDEIFARRALKAIQHQSYATARGWLQRRNNRDELVRGLRFQLNDADELVLGSAAGRLPSPERSSTKALCRLKMRLIEDGLFRYDDMDAIGMWYAKRNKIVVQAIAYRFPAILIDETQDTHPRQGAILDYLFENRSVVQRFGDDRQAIYRGTGDDEEGIPFPKDDHLSMTTSMRLSPTIAALSQNICIGEVEVLSGQQSRQNHTHTVYLFRPEHIQRVMQAFARLVAAELGCGLPPHRIMAVGFRRSGQSDPDKIPYVIGDYFKAGQRTILPVNAIFDSLADYVHMAHADVRCGRTTKSASLRLLHAACRILELQGVRDQNRPFSIHRLLRQLREKDHPYAPKLLRSFGELLLSGTMSKTIDVADVKTTIQKALVPLHDGKWNQQVEEFCCNAPTTMDHEGEPGMEASDGIFRLALDHGTVEVGVGTIHSVKGETLDAILVLTTYFYNHDLKQLVDTGLLCGRRPTSAQSKQKRLQENVKRIHVAMTRPTRLLCLAMHEDHVPPAMRAELQQLGWTFHTVAMNADAVDDTQSPG